MSRKLVSLILGVAVGALLSASAAVGQTDSKSTSDKSTTKSTTTRSKSSNSSAPDTSQSRMAQTPSSTSLAKSDASFLKKAAMGGMEEVELGKIAAEKATDPDVKKFGQKMVDDHSKANDELMKLAQQKNLEVPRELDAKAKKEVDRFNKLSGAAFDKAYMKEMVSDHKKDVAEFQKAANTAKDSDVKNFATTTLPTLKEHLEMAKTDNSKVAGISTSHKTTRTAKTS